MLPLGRKNARRCTECDITCHANCAHLVPDFCGMSMETANQLLRDWRDINKARTRQGPASSRTSVPPMSQSQGQQPYSPGYSVDQVSSGMERIRVTGGEPQPPPKSPDYQYRQQQPPQDMRVPGQQPMQQPPAGYPQQPSVRPSPGGRPPFPTEPVQSQSQSPRPMGGYDQSGEGYQVSSCHSFAQPRGANRT